MARRRREEEDLERDADPIASLLLQPQSPMPPLVAPSYTPKELFDEIEDRRRFTPDPWRALDTGGLVSSYRAHPRSTTNALRRKTLQVITAFEAPKKALICVRRKARREVIFAKRKRKKGAGASRRRRNYFSNVRC